MKVKFTILLLLVFTISFGQTKQLIRRDKLNRIIPYDIYNVDSTNHIYYCNQFLRLVNYHNFDSSKKAIDIFRSLVYFDEEKYSVSNYYKQLQQIKTEAYKYFKTSFEGQWKFEWSGSNWGTDETSKTRNHKIVFKNDSALFFTNDTLTRQTSFKLLNRFGDRIGLGVLQFQIHFSDNNEIWDFKLYNKSFVPYIGKTNSFALLINKMPNCSCGCPEEAYEKNPNNEIVKKE